MHKNFELCLRCRNPSSLDLKTRFIPFEACEALGRCIAEAGEGEMAFFAIDLSDSMLPNVTIKISTLCSAGNFVKCPLQECLIALLEGISSSGAVRRLDLRGNQLEAEAVEAIAALVQRNSSILQ